MIVCLGLYPTKDKLRLKITHYIEHYNIAYTESYLTKKQQLFKASLIKMTYIFIFKSSITYFRLCLIFRNKFGLAHLQKIKSKTFYQIYFIQNLQTPTMSDLLKIKKGLSKQSNIF